MIAKPLDKGSEFDLDVAADDAPILAMVQETIAAGEPAQVDGVDELLTLSLDDLLADQNGEVVLFNDSNMRAVNLETTHRVLQSGETHDHHTIAGDDVSGFNFMSFDNGTTLYFNEGLNVIVIEPNAQG